MASGQPSSSESTSNALGVPSPSVSQELDALKVKLSKSMAPEDARE